jgi:hypothetical protein
MGKTANLWCSLESRPLMSPMSREFAILTMYLSATEEQREQGEAWYQTAKDAAKELAKQYDVSYRCAAGVIAVLSPRSKWNKNKEDAKAILRAVTSGSKIVPVCSAYGANVRKAWRIAKGESPASVLGGPKVNAFYRNICGDYNGVTVDVWAARVAEPYNHRFPGRDKDYAVIADAYSSAAEKLGTWPAFVQAICWVAVRKDDGNGTDLQIDLWNEDAA